MKEKEKVLNAIIVAFKNNADILDIMETVNANTLEMTEIQFSEAMYMLQMEKIINGVEFEDGNPQKITMWDKLKVLLPEFRVTD